MKFAYEKLGMMGVEELKVCPDVVIGEGLVWLRGVMLGLQESSVRIVEAGLGEIGEGPQW